MREVAELLILHMDYGNNDYHNNIIVVFVSRFNKKSNELRRREVAFGYFLIILSTPSSKGVLKYMSEALISRRGSVGGGGGPSYLKTETIIMNTDWVVPIHNGDISVRIFGGGGAGIGWLMQGYGCAGGGGGWMNNGEFNLNNGDTAIITIGLGGRSFTSNYDSRWWYNADSGGTSSFVCGSYSLSANGGEGGKIANTESSATGGSGGSGGGGHMTPGRGWQFGGGGGSQYGAGGRGGTWGGGGGSGNSSGGMGGTYGGGGGAGGGGSGASGGTYGGKGGNNTVSAVNGTNTMSNTSVPSECRGWGLLGTMYPTGNKNGICGGGGGFGGNGGGGLWSSTQPWYWGGGGGGGYGGNGGNGKGLSWSSTSAASGGGGGGYGKGADGGSNGAGGGGGYFSKGGDYGGGGGGYGPGGGLGVSGGYISPGFAGGGGGGGSGGTGICFQDGGNGICIIQYYT